MGRIGLSYYEVADACDALAAEGQTPTVDRVSQLLKTTSSRTTISNHIKNRRELRDSRATTRLPEPLSALLTDQTQKIYASIESSVAGQFAKEREGYERRMSELEAEIGRMMVSNSEKDAVIADRNEEILALNRSLAAKNAMITDINLALTEAKAEATEARGRIRELQEVVASKSEEISKAITGLEANTAGVAELTKAQSVLGGYVAGIGAELPKLRATQDEVMQAILEGFKAADERILKIMRERDEAAPDQNRARKEVLAKVRRRLASGQ